MTAIDFPDTPEVNDTFTVGSITWKWDGLTWKSQGAVIQGPEGPQGDQGPQGEPGSDAESDFDSLFLMGA